MEAELFSEQVEQILLQWLWEYIS